MFLNARALPQLQVYMLIWGDNLSYTMASCVIELDLEDEASPFQCTTKRIFQSLGTE